MGTTLTGTTPATTYDSLIKVTDNGPISGTAKYLSDGLGNDSVLALSTSKVGIGTSNPSADLHISSSFPEIRLQDNAYPATNHYSTIDGNGGSGILSLSADASNTAANSAMLFKVDSAERMRITSAGELQLTGNGVVRNQHSSANYSYWQQSDVDARLFVQYAQPLIFGTNAAERMRISSTGNVGIGTSSPVTALDVNGEVSVAFNATYGVRFYNQDRNNWSFIGNSVATGGTNANLRLGDATGEVMIITGGKVGIGTNIPQSKLHINKATQTIGTTIPSGGVLIGDTAGGNMVLELGMDRASVSYIQSRNITSNTLYNLAINPSGGNVGIGTSAPTYKLEIFDGGGSSLAVGASTGKAFLYADNSGATLGALSAIPLRFNINGSEVGRFLAGGGLTFNGDTAAANALDSYEEGTWTMGVSFGGAAVGVTYAANTGSYTKIGRQVTATGYLQLSSKGSSTGDARITGLPFTINNSDAAAATAGVRFNLVTFANQFQAWGQSNTTTVFLEEITISGVVSNITDADFANNSQVNFSLTYFV